MKTLTVIIPEHIRPFLRGLIKCGTHGGTESDVVIAMIESELRQLIKDEYFKKAFAMMQELRK